MKLLTPEMVAERLSVSRSTVLRLIADGVLPAVCVRSNFGSMKRRKAVYRIRQEVLEKFIMERESKPIARKGLLVIEK